MTVSLQIDGVATVAFGVPSSLEGGLGVLARNWGCAIGAPFAVANRSGTLPMGRTMDWSAMEWTMGRLVKRQDRGGRAV